MNYTEFRMMDAAVLNLYFFDKIINFNIQLEEKVKKFSRLGMLLSHFNDMIIYR